MTAIYAKQTITNQNIELIYMTIKRKIFEKDVDFIGPTIKSSI